MTAAAFVVGIDGTTFGRTLQNGVDTVAVFANSSSEAKETAKAVFGATMAALWDDATVTTVAAAADLNGWTVHIKIIASDQSVTLDFSLESIAADSIDAFAAKIVTALNLTAVLANAAYNSSTQVLTVAGAADGLGDHELIVEFYAAGSAQNVPIPGFASSIVDGGASGDPLTVTLPADGYTIPKVISKLSRQ